MRWPTSNAISSKLRRLAPSTRLAIDQVSAMRQVIEADPAGAASTASRITASAKGWASGAKWP